MQLDARDNKCCTGRPCIVFYAGKRIPAIFHTLAPYPTNYFANVKKGEMAAFVELINGKTDYVSFDQVYFSDTKERLKAYNVSYINNFIEFEEHQEKQIKDSLLSIYPNVEFKVFTDAFYSTSEEFEMYLVFEETDFEESFIKLLEDWIKEQDIKIYNYICITKPCIYDKISSIWDINLYRNFIRTYH